MDDRASIDAVTTAFFGSFSNAGGKVSLGAMRRLFLDAAVIVKSGVDGPEVYTLGQFIEPRERLLNDGSIENFEEHETLERTEIFGNIGHRFSRYEKTWTADGASYSGRGAKSIQFVRTASGWKISALSWEDEA